MDPIAPGVLRNGGPESCQIFYLGTGALSHPVILEISSKPSYALFYPVDWQPVMMRTAAQMH